MDPIPHAVHEFGVEARKPGRAWETAFNGPIQTWTDADTGQPMYGVTVRLARLKDSETRELYSTNLLFYLTPEQMRGMHNIYDMARTVPFTRIRGPLTPVPHCPHREGKLWYDPNPEGVIMEDVRQAPVTLRSGRPGFFVTGQGYRGKVMLPDGEFIHDVGVYGGYLDPSERPAQLELTHLFGGIEFGARPDGSQADAYLAELGDGIWVKGIIGNTVDEVHVESFKNSVRLPNPRPGRTLIGARSMSETKLLYYFGSEAADGLSGYGMCGFIDGLPSAIGERVWERVHRVGLGSNFVPCPELGGWLGMIHVVLEKNNPAYPETMDSLYPDIEEQYEGWMTLLRFDGAGKPVIHACLRALTPDDVPICYEGAGELFDSKRVAFPISLYRTGDALHVGYGWGDRALFRAEFDYCTVVRQLRRHSVAQ
ncbi:MAG: hypothetical protein JO250_21080 [Armatimonadetes bacterium]|nr:hypothetical protein [Armatimonadota bacterium]